MSKLTKIARLATPHGATIDYYQRIAAEAEDALQDAEADLAIALTSVENWKQNYYSEVNLSDWWRVKATNAEERLASISDLLDEMGARLGNGSTVTHQQILELERLAKGEGGE